VEGHCSPQGDWPHRIAMRFLFLPPAFSGFRGGKFSLAPGGSSSSHLSEAWQRRYSPRISKVLVIFILRYLFHWLRFSSRGLYDTDSSFSLQIVAYMRVNHCALVPACLVWSFSFLPFPCLRWLRCLSSGMVTRLLSLIVRRLKI
jgi:hypothetical protein